MGERLVCNQEVEGSIPFVSTPIPEQPVIRTPRELDPMETPIRLIARGLGLQLSTSRMTAHDLVPYFQAASSYDEIIRWIPSLTHEEIAVVEH